MPPAPQTAGYAITTHATSGAPRAPPGKPNIWHASWGVSWRLAQGERVRTRSAPEHPGVFGNSSHHRVLGTRGHLYLLTTGCSVPEATSIQINIIFVRADDLDLATARQLLALGPMLAEKGASFENTFVGYSTRCVAPRVTILTSLYSHNHGVRGNVFAEGGFEKFRNEGNEKNTVAVHPQESGYQTACSSSTSTSTRETTPPTSRPAGTSGTAGWMRTSSTITR